MKPVKYGILSFLTGVYLTAGGFGWYVYAMFLAIKITRRNFSDDPKLPYPFFFYLGFIGFSIAYLVITGILIYKLFKKSPRGKSFLVKAGLFILPIVCSFYLTKEGITYWQSTPHISKEKAIQIAIKEHQSADRNILRGANWDGGSWIVTFSDQEGFGCDTYSISRLGLTVSGGPCVE